MKKKDILVTLMNLNQSRLPQRLKDDYENTFSIMTENPKFSVRDRIMNMSLLLSLGSIFSVFTAADGLDLQAVTEH